MVTRQFEKAVERMRETVELDPQQYNSRMRLSFGLSSEEIAILRLGQICASDQGCRKLFIRNVVSCLRITPMTYFPAEDF